MAVRTSFKPGEPTWIDLGSSDLPGSHAFYSALFGWVAGEGDPAFGGYGMYTKDGKNVAGFAPLMFPGQPVAWTSYVSVDDADKTAALVTENGGTVHAAPMDVGDLGRMALFMDPVQGFLGVWQPRAMTGADLTDEEGTLSWIELSTRDLPTALDFYGKVFGWTVQKSDDYNEFQLDGTSVAGAMTAPEGAPAERPSFWMPYFGADDPAGQATRAGELGATVLVPYMEVGGVAFSVVTDPQGATFGLLKILAS
jgi:predicted enzyme related to lactoylglutathione lyase